MGSFLACILAALLTIHSRGLAALAGEIRTLHGCFFGIVLTMHHGKVAVALPIRNLHGAGASFPAQIYKVWLASFQSERSPFVYLNTSYDVTGSGAGKERIKGTIAPHVDYAGSDSLLKDSDYDQYPNLRMFPTMAGAVVLGFNLPGINKINLTREQIVGIYNGSITSWSDRSISAVNPGITLPNVDIAAIARSDKSGTTEIMSTALSLFNQEWADTYGVFSRGVEADGKSHWNDDAIAYFGYTTRGVTGLLMSIKYTIGYLSLADARQAHIPYALLYNKMGNLVAPDTMAIQEAMDVSNQMTATLSDVNSAGAYPISGYTYLIVRMNSTHVCDTPAELYRYIEWFLYDDIARLECEQFNMVPISLAVADRISSVILSKMMCEGKQVKSIVREEKQKEQRSLQTWRLTVSIIAPMISVGLLVFLSFIIGYQVKVNRALYRKEWKIWEYDLSIVTHQTTRSKGSFTNSHKSVSSIVSGGSRSGLSSSFIVAYWKDLKTLIRPINIPSSGSLNWKAQRLILWMRDNIHHENLQKMYGITDIANATYIVSDMCVRGVLRDVLQDDRYQLDNNFKFSMSIDIATGMAYLHGLNIVHANLSTISCFIDQRWNVKIGNWEFCSLANSSGILSVRTTPQLFDHEPEEITNDGNILAKLQYWTAPELLENHNTQPTAACDVYGFAIVLVEVFSREDPFYDIAETKSPKQIIEEVCEQDLRPNIPDSMPKAVSLIVRKAWNRAEKFRPDFRQILVELKTANPTKKSVLDCMMEQIENYVVTLEEKVNERTQELAVTMHSLEDLLHQMLPPSAASKLAKGESVEPESFESVTIFFSDIVGFTQISAESTPMEIVEFLNDLYTCFDAILERYDVYKVETIGDAYMVISGLPRRNGIQHAAEIATMALDLATASNVFCIQHRPQETLQLRVGIHSGPVVGGVVGIKMPRYCLFGDTVNTASRMESTSVAMKIQISYTTDELLHRIAKFTTLYRGEIPVKGKGSMKTFWLHGKEGREDSIPPSFLRDIDESEINLLGK